MKSKKPYNSLVLLLTVVIACCVIVPFYGCSSAQQPQETNSTSSQSTESTEVENIKLSKSKCSIKVGKTVKLKATVYPQNANDKYVEWVSDDDDIAIVNSEGLVTGKKAGVTNIIARAVNGKEASCTVTVKKKTKTAKTSQTITQYYNYEYNQPFYGIWCFASKNYDSAEKIAENLNNLGYNNATVLLSTDWSNLNPERWYVVTAGLYPDKSAANASLADVKSIYSDAYIKYSGDWQG